MVTARLDGHLFGFDLASGAPEGALEELEGRFSSYVMIDLHCHFLPGIDDGAQTMEEALSLARAAVSNGIRHAVMTPHIHAGVFENKKSLIEQQVGYFRTALCQAKISLSISVGAEARIGPELIELIEGDELPFLGRFGGEKVMLLELPHSHVPVGADRLVAWLRAKAIRPLIAHPERNKDVMRSIDHLRPLTALGCLLQVTAGSLTGHFGPQARRVAVQLLEEELIFAVATDAHNLEHRPPDLAAGRAEVERLTNAVVADLLTRTNPARLLGLSAATLAGPLQFVAQA